MTFTKNDFKSVFIPRNLSEYQNLVERVGEEWEKIWSDYVASYEKREPYTQKEKARKKEEYPQRRMRLGGTHYKGPHLVRFLEYFIKDYEDQKYRGKDRLILIFLTSRIREGLRDKFNLFGPNPGDLPETEVEEKNLGLCWLLLEWREQVLSLTENDALTSALVRSEAPPEEIAWAQIGHARRMRAGIGSARLKFPRQVGRDNVELKKIEISERLLRSAEAMIEKIEKMEDIDQFCYVPTGSFTSYIKLQHALNHSRSGNQRNAAEKALELLGTFNSDDGTAPDDHSDKYLIWWCYHILIRASSASLDESKFSIYKKQMTVLEEGLDGNFSKYFRAFHSTGDGDPDTGEKDRWRGRMTREESEDFKRTKPYELIETFRNWKRFYGPEVEKGQKTPDCENVGDSYRARYVRVADRSDEWSSFLGVAGKPQAEFFGFHRFHKIAHEGSGGRTFQRLTATIGTREAFRKRISRMIEEIDEARFASLMRMDAYTCVILEILGRALVYRLWFEVIKMPRSTEKWKMNSLSDQIEHSIRVLERIKDGINSSRAFDSDEDDIGFIDDFIVIFNKMLTIEGEKRIIKTEWDVEKFASEIRREMNHQHEQGRRKYNSQPSFLGIPWAEAGDSMMKTQHSFLERSRPSQ